MKRKGLKTRLLTLLTLVVILIPMITMTVYAASSPKTNFSFNFQEGAGTMWQSGTKTDRGESTQYAAGVNVTGGYFGVGSVRFFIVDRDYVTLTNTKTVNALGSFSLTYYESLLAQMSDSTVNLGGSTSGGVQACGGYFQP